MNRHIIIPSLVFFAVALLVSCAPQRTAFDVQAVRQSIESTNAKLAAEYVSGDTAAILSHYTDDVTVCVPGFPMHQGKKSYGEFLGSMPQMGVKITGMTFATVSVSGSGDYAYEVGTYVSQIMVGGEKSETDRGKYVAVWKQHTDGTWKIQADIWNSDQPPMMPSPEPEKKKK